MTQTRRLAAILAADVAGYSRLIGADEGGTLRRLRAIREELIDPTITAHHGRLVKTTGDGLLVELDSRVKDCSLLPGGLAMISSPAASGSSPSTSFPIEPGRQGC